MDVVTFEGSPPGAMSWIIGSPFGIILWIALLLIGAAVWILLARSSLVHGGRMERSDRVPQLYGYTVCLITIVVMLANVNSLVNRAKVLSDPLVSHDAYGWSGVVLTSFESYKATMDRERFVMPGSTTEPAPRLTDVELRARYEALRADRIARAKGEARRDITSSMLLLLISGVLFVWHWRLVRRGGSSAGVAAA